MGENSKIEWCDHTHNFWVGCTAISPACDHCYAEAWAKRTGHAELWKGERRRTTEANWQKPIKWNAEAERLGIRYRVFTNSLADFFDNQIETRWRDDAWHYIEQTPHLDWLLLTKRPQNISKMLPTQAIGCKPWDAGWPNVWLGTTVCNQEEADRNIPHLLDVPAALRFVSAEPLLGPIDFNRLPREATERDRAMPGFADVVSFVHSALHAQRGLIMRDGKQWWSEKDGPRLDWIIVGGESGKHARPMHPDWARGIRDQCARAADVSSGAQNKQAGVAFFFKQWGEWREARHGDEFDTAKGRAQKPPAFIVAVDGTVHCFFNEQMGPRTRAMLQVGKKAAGRSLDGVTHDAFPARSHP